MISGTLSSDGGGRNQKQLSACYRENPAALVSFVGCMSIYMLWEYIFKEVFCSWYWLTGLNALHLVWSTILGNEWQISACVIIRLPELTESRLA